MFRLTVKSLLVGAALLASVACASWEPEPASGSKDGRQIHVYDFCRYLRETYNVMLSKVGKEYDFEGWAGRYARQLVIGLPGAKPTFTGLRLKNTKVNKSFWAWGKNPYFYGFHCQCNTKPKRSRQQYRRARLPRCKSCHSSGFVNGTKDLISDELARNTVCSRGIRKALPYILSEASICLDEKQDLLKATNKVKALLMRETQSAVAAAQALAFEDGEIVAHEIKVPHQKRRRPRNEYSSMKRVPEPVSQVAYYE